MLHFYVLEHVKGSTETNLEGELIVTNDKKSLHNGVNEKWEKQDSAQAMLEEQ